MGLIETLHGNNDNVDMSRRGFLKGMGLALGTVAIPGLVFPEDVNAGRISTWDKDRDSRKLKDAFNFWKNGNRLAYRQLMRLEGPNTSLRPVSEEFIETDPLYWFMGKNLGILGGGDNPNDSEMREFNIALLHVQKRPGHSGPYITTMDNLVFNSQNSNIRMWASGICLFFTRDKDKYVPIYKNAVNYSIKEAHRDIREKSRIYG